jgi:hypothetical protein
VGFRIIETREADRLLSALVQIASDNTPESRYYGRRAVSVLMAHPDFARLSSKLLADGPGRTLKQITDTITTKGIGDLPSDTSKTMRPTREASVVESSPMRKTTK